MLIIKGWNEYFENHRSRDVKAPTWVALPNKHDGEGFSILLTEHEDGVAHYGAWVLMVQVASKCEPRGVLRRDDGTPLDARALGLKTRAPKATFEAAIPRLIEIGWLEDVSQEEVNDRIERMRDDSAEVRDDARQSRATPRDGAESRGDAADMRGDAAGSRGETRRVRASRARAGREGNGMEGNRREGGTRADAHEAPPGATAPEPPPPLSASPLPEPDPEVWDDEPPIDAEGVLHAWGVQAKLRNRIPGPMTPKEAAQIATACPDAPRLRDAMTIAFLSESPPAPNFFAKDLGRWVALGDEYRRRMDRGDVSPPDAAREVLAAKKKRGA